MNCYYSVRWAVDWMLIFEAVVYHRMHQKLKLEERGKKRDIKGINDDFTRETVVL